MEWITNNGLVLVLLAVCIGMHFLGGHGSHGKHSEEESDHHKGHTDTGSPDESHARKGHSGCH